ncbi:hypothetical protein Patl1_33892 [Pistacia atlantica]|uniref:Uncharacterized protein n=1 Tax=Pistacia atlantica TaxID=434234 RepID=A0ACC0ZWS5_9ROSI|nr:hypothetical protein Patl1_33892 [Pistacia atlantica]
MASEDIVSPFFLNPNDGPGTLLTNHLLTPEKNHSWARIVRRSLQIKNKLGFIYGTLLEPSSTDALLEPWQRFAQNNGPRIFELKQSIHNINQGDDSVSLYFSKLKSLFDELLNFEFIPSCTCGAMKPALENQQHDWMMKFLTGLNDSFSNIRAQIILLKSIPSLSEAYAFVQQEEKHKQISNLPNLHDIMALATRTHYLPTRDNPKSFSSQQQDKFFLHFLQSLKPFFGKMF